jgi:hypothetical protein
MTKRIEKDRGIFDRVAAKEERNGEILQDYLQELMNRPKKRQCFRGFVMETISLDNLFVRGDNRVNIAAEIHSHYYGEDGCGGPKNLGRTSRRPGKRALPGPSPSANLVGVWKGKRLKSRPPLPAVFLFSPFPAPLKRRTYAMRT